MTAEPELICDLFEWLPPWGEFDVRARWDQSVGFVVDVDYEVGEAGERDKPILTKSIVFAMALHVVKTTHPLPKALHHGVRSAEIGRGQLFDLGETALVSELRAAREQQRPGSHFRGRHFYVYFEDMAVTYQIIANEATVS